MKVQPQAEGNFEKKKTWTNLTAAQKKSFAIGVLYVTILGSKKKRITQQGRGFPSKKKNGTQHRRKTEGGGGGPQGKGF